MALESTYPYTGGDDSCAQWRLKPAVAIDGYYSVIENNATQLQTAIATIGPIAISIAASSDAFQNVRNMRDLSGLHPSRLTVSVCL